MGEWEPSGAVGGEVGAMAAGFTGAPRRARQPPAPRPFTPHAAPPREPPRVPLFPPVAPPAWEQRPAPTPTPTPAPICERWALPAGLLCTHRARRPFWRQVPPQGPEPPIRTPPGHPAEPVPPVNSCPGCCLQLVTEKALPRPPQPPPQTPAPAQSLRGVSVTACLLAAPAVRLLRPPEVPLWLTFVPEAAGPRVTPPGCGRACRAAARAGQ